MKRILITLLVALEVFLCITFLMVDFTEDVDAVAKKARNAWLTQKAVMEVAHER
jgi:hypothetical protein